MSGQDDMGSPHGGGPQGEPVEGSLTDGGSLPGAPRQDRSFGAGRHADLQVPEARDGGDAAVSGVIAARKIFEGSGEDPGVVESGPNEAGLPAQGSDTQPQ